LRNKKKIEDLRDVWPERLEKGKRVLARTDTAGMTRPPRDPMKRALLAERGQLGPFREAEVRDGWRC
jgi:hypothetical protein